MKRYLECGRVVSTHGVRGEFKVQPWCDCPEDLLDLQTLYFSPEEPVKIQRSRVHKGMVILKAQGIDTMDDANLLRGRTLYLDREDLTVEEGSYFVADLIGLEAVDADTGRSYGRVTDVLETGANDVYELKDEKGRVRLVPAIAQVVLSVELEEGRMVIRPLEGLFDED